MAFFSYNKANANLESSAYGHSSVKRVPYTKLMPVRLNYDAMRLETGKRATDNYI